MKCEFAELNEQITFQTYTEVADGLGGKTHALADISTDPTVWAKVIVLSGKEGQAQNRTASTTRYQFRIMNRNDITEDMVISWNSRVFNIVAVLYRGEQDYFLHIETELGVAA